MGLILKKMRNAICRVAAAIHQWRILDLDKRSTQVNPDYEFITLVASCFFERAKNISAIPNAKRVNRTS